MAGIGTGTGIGIANAPCSWGVLEFEGMEGRSAGWAQVLDEIAATGYVGTELGDWGFMPTDPAVLRAELERRGLAMVGAFVPVRFADRAGWEEGEAHALRVARLLAALDGIAGAVAPPVVVLADVNGTDPVRTRNAGRVTPAMGLDADGWRTYAAGVDRVARRVREETGLRGVFHPHAAGWVETPAEIATLLELTDPDAVGVVFDTGHYTYGTGSDDPVDIAAALDALGPRLGHVHFKDIAPAVAARARAEGWDYFTAVRHGLFAELGQGAVDFPAVARWLREQRYGGWEVVEQDVLPGMGSPRESAARNREYLRAIGA